MDISDRWRTFSANGEEILLFQQKNKINKMYCFHSFHFAENRKFSLIYSDTVANEDNAFRNHILETKYPLT